MELDNKGITTPQSKELLIVYLKIREKEYQFFRKNRINTLAGEILRMLFTRHLTGFKGVNTTSNISSYFFTTHQPIAVNRALNKCIKLSYIIREGQTSLTKYTLTANFIKEYKKVLSLD